MNRVREMLKIDMLYRAGITGAGVGVAVLDSGVFSHGDLKGRIAAVHSVLEMKEDDNGHGTHVAGIIAGDGSLSHGKWRGIAPGAHIVAVKVLRRNGLGKAKDLQKGLDWVLENRAAYGIRIANISIGARPEGVPEEEILIRGVETLWNAGIVVVTAAGNNGPGAGTVTVPGSSRRVITVGASDDATPVWMGGQRREGYSGCGPVPDSCVVKPEVVAPAGHIMSLSHRYQGYTAKSGTSMAAPIVAGVIALLLGQRPELTPKEVKKMLYQTSTDLGQPREKQGWGMVCPERLIALSEDR